MGLKDNIIHVRLVDILRSKEVTINYITVLRILLGRENVVFIINGMMPEVDIGKTI